MNTNLMPLSFSFKEIDNNELKTIDGGIGVVAGSLIVAGVIFTAGAVTGLCESYSNNKK